MITDISRASRVDAELAREDVGPFDLGGLLASLAEAYSEASSSQTPVVFESQVRNSRVLGREGPLGQVFRNLIDNAITFSPPGGKVYVTAIRGQREPRETMLITVDDDGPGIPEENLEAVFDRFYTQRPTGAAFGTHSGLGLAISRQIIKAHGGRITASNRCDVTGACLGARFTVELPAAPAH